MLGEIMEKKLLNITEASKILGISNDTLRSWDKSNRFKAIRTVGNHRRYREEDIVNFLNSTKNNFSTNINELLKEITCNTKVF